MKINKLCIDLCKNRRKFLSSVDKNQKKKLKLLDYVLLQLDLIKLLEPAITATTGAHFSTANEGLLTL